MTADDCLRRIDALVILAEGEQGEDLPLWRASEVLREAREMIRTLSSVDANVQAVQERLGNRAAIGLLKYGVTTEREDLSREEWLQHAQDEALDLSVYLQRLKGGR